MELYIKNMVCARCIKTVVAIFEAIGAKPGHVELGKIIVKEKLTDEQNIKVKELLVAEGFELLDDAKTKLVEEVKSLIVNLVHYGDLDSMKQNLSTWLVNRLHKDYNYLSNLFSSIENNTIEQFFILQKVEKIKEWLVYDELTLSEISLRLGYSSLSHLCNQFKRITGFTPSAFRRLKDHHRKPLDMVFQ